MDFSSAIMCYSEKSPTHCVNWVGWAPIGAIIVWLTRLRFDDLPAKIRKIFYSSKKLSVN